MVAEAYLSYGSASYLDHLTWWHARASDAAKRGVPVAPLRAELDQANAHALDRDDGRATFMAVAEILRAHGMLVRALSEAAHYDAEAERLWRSFNEPVIARFAEKLRADVCGPLEFGGSWCQDRSGVVAR